jgi:Amiloride-sensitive sodium channel
LLLIELAVTLLEQVEAQQKVRSIMFESSVADAVVDKPSLTIDGVWASLGGVLSLWLGINVMTIVEFIELLYVSVRNRYRMRSVSQENDAASDQKKTDAKLGLSDVA